MTTAHLMNQLIDIRDGLYGKRIIVGTFPLIKLITPSASDHTSKRDRYAIIVKDGKQIRLHVWIKDITLIGGKNVDSHAGHSAIPQVQYAPVVEISDADLSTTISKRFAVMDRMVEGVVEGTVRSLIVSGAAGISKTYTLEKRLSDAYLSGKVTKFSHLKGKITTMALYAQLFKHKDAGNVILFDDIDVFGNEDSLNYLKGALDTGKRNITWLSSSTDWLDENGISTDFNFEGSVVFITNVDFDKVIEKGGKDAVHYQALVDRSNYLDLMVHSNREIFIRIKQIVETSNICANCGIAQIEGKEILDWVEENKDIMRKISIRTFLKIASYMISDKTDWRDTATVLLMKK
jgi:hypothetical protein